MYLELYSTVKLLFGRTLCSYYRVFQMKISEMIMAFLLPYREWLW
uniref:Uncharacterized protein n=1 Tax=Arundo donax TaxID=35708 RepID=A0A0A9GH38_ARUDO